MKVAVIPARGGSKRIPLKNIKPFCGKPIIAYSIGIAYVSGLFDKVIVSTDNKEIAKVSQHHGAETPFMRPEKLSDDYVGTTQVISHSAKWMIDNGWQVDVICCIYPTAPLIDVKDLKLAYNIFLANEWDCVYAATEFVYPFQRSFKLNEDGTLKMFFPQYYHSRSQDLEVAYHDAGQFYWSSTEVWLENRTNFSEKSTIVKIPAYRTVDIDTKEDWLRAEVIFKSLGLDKK